MQIKLRALILGTATLIITACASTPKLPPQQPITSGIFDHQPPKSPISKVAGGPKTKLAVLLTKNTIENTDYVTNRLNTFRARYTEEWSRAHIEMLDPIYPLESIAHSLKNKFGHVQLIESIRQMDKDSFDALALVNIYYEPYGSIGSGVDSTTARVSVTFYDRELRYIGTAGSQEYKAELAASCCWSLQGTVDASRNGFQPLMQALKEFDNNLTTLVDSRANSSQ